MRGYAQGLREGHEAGVRAGRSAADVDAKRKMTRHERYQAGFADGFNTGRDVGRAEVPDSYRSGYDNGFRAGVDSAQHAVNTAYGRGFKDGAAGVDLNGKQKPRTRRRA